MSREDDALKKDVKCTCDGCGKIGRCTMKQEGPKGWFFAQVQAPDDDYYTTVLACSEACKTLKWKKQR